MAKAHSNEPTRADKPRKPYPDFPLGWHVAGYWCKRIRGRLHYFGQRNGTWEEALLHYQDVRDDLHAGREPRQKNDPNAVTIKYAFDHFLTEKERSVESGELTDRSFQEYVRSCKRFGAEFGNERLLSDLRPEDFAAYRAKLAKAWAPTTLTGEILRVRVALKHAYDAGLIESPVRYGTQFKLPTKKTLRVHRNEKGERLFNASELRQLIDAADVQLRAMILLAINCGFGNRDCGRLEMKHLDLDKQWVRLPRSKTGIRRHAPLWQETVEAIRAALEKRYTPRDKLYADLIFVTKYKRAWYCESGKDDAISKAFRKLLDSEDLYRPGLSFYALRHQFETIGGECLDQVAVSYLMGHSDTSMSSVYRERISDERLLKVAEHIHGWLFGGSNK